MSFEFSRKPREINELRCIKEKNEKRKKRRTNFVKKKKKKRKLLSLINLRRIKFVRKHVCTLSVVLIWNYPIRRSLFCQELF